MAKPESGMKSSKPISPKSGGEPSRGSVKVVLAITTENNGRRGYRKLGTEEIRQLSVSGKPYSLEHLSVPTKEWEDAKV